MAVHEDIMEKDTGIAKDGGGKLSYADAVEERSKIETKIGLSLAKNANLTKIAAKITEKAKVKSYGELDEASKKKTTGQVGTFGGAAAFKEGWGTLGSSVSAVMTEIEKDPATKAKYSVSHAENHPYFPTDQKKPEFDKPIADCKWEELSQEIQIYLNNKSDQALVIDRANPPNPIPMPVYKYDDLKGDTQKELLKDYRYENSSIDTATVDYIAPDPTTLARYFNPIVGIQPVSPTTKEAVKNLVTNPTNNELRTTAKAAIIQEMAKTQDESLKAQLGALLDIVVDRHTSGDHTNIVSKNGDGGVKDQWIEDTVAAGKPIISGPSGHTLRYLNFWAEKRNENIVDARKHEEWPSLEAARLVMMADLLPPRHHSYDEVMTASIGIKDEASDALKYEHKSSYEDLSITKHKDRNAGNIAQTAYEKSGAQAADGANTQGIAAAERAIANQRNVRKDKQDAINQFIEAAKDKAAAQIRTAITALTAPPPN